LDGGQQLDRIPELTGERDVFARERVDAGYVNLARANPESIREGGEDDRLVRGVPSVDVERGIRFRVAQRLCLGKCVGKLEAGLGHPGENVIAGAVEDAVNAFKAIADEGFPDRLD